MAGTSVKITLDDADFQAAMGDLLQRLQHPQAVFADIGEYLVRQVEQRFESETGPDGEKWAALHPGTRAAKNHPKILSESLQLRRSIVHQETDDGLVMGSNKIYAAIHQLGGTTRPHTITARHKKALAWPGMGEDGHPVRSVQHPGSVVPARPYLGLSTSDKEEVLTLLAEHLTEATE